MIADVDIPRLLPHRFPMLLVDGVLDIVPGEHIVAIKALSHNEPWYADMPRGAPAYPPVLLIESFAQSAGLLGLLSAGDPESLRDKVMLFGSMAGVRFHQPALPGNILRNRVRLRRAVGDTVIFDGDSVISDESVLTVSSMVMTFRSAEQLRPDGQGPTTGARKLEEAIHGSP